MMHKLLLAVLALCPLAGCSSTVESLAKDPATVSVHQTITAPGWSVTTDYSRANSGGAAATAGSNGATVNTPAAPPSP
jgi:uncharacterized lipoprotein YajG